MIGIAGAAEGSVIGTVKASENARSDNSCLSSTNVGVAKNPEEIEMRAGGCRFDPCGELQKPEVLLHLVGCADRKRTKGGGRESASAERFKAAPFGRFELPTIPNELQRDETALDAGRGASDVPDFKRDFREVIVTRKIYVLKNKLWPVLGQKLIPRDASLGVRYIGLRSCDGDGLPLSPPKAGCENRHDNTGKCRNKAIVLVGPVEKPDERGRYSVPLGALIWGAIIALVAYLAQRPIMRRDPVSYDHDHRDDGPSNNSLGR